MHYFYNGLPRFYCCEHHYCFHEENHFLHCVIEAAIQHNFLEGCCEHGPLRLHIHLAKSEQMPPFHQF